MAEERHKEQLAEYIRDHIRQFREEAGMSQAELGEALGKSNSNISDIERGRLDISAAELAIVARALHKPVALFYPFREFGRPKADELSALETEIIINLRRIPYTAVYDIILNHIKDLAAWTEKDEFQRMAQELMRAGKVLLGRD